MSAAQKIHASTQKFTEIVDFLDNVVIMEGGNACLIIEITASNFALLSKREQDSRIFSYASLLNSLSFPIQILIRNKRLDISSYLKELDEQVKTSKNQRLQAYIGYYRDFVQEMVTVNVVLNKSFYIVIPFSSLEMGIAGAKQASQKSTPKNKKPNGALPEGAEKNLQSKAQTVLSQLQKFAVSARILEREDLVKLFYDIYNEGTKIEVEQIEPSVNAAIVTGGPKS